jgi:hypothetical protein
MRVHNSMLAVCFAHCRKQMALMDPANLMQVGRRNVKHPHEIWSQLLAPLLLLLADKHKNQRISARVWTVSWYVQVYCCELQVYCCELQLQAAS